MPCFRVYDPSGVVVFLRMLTGCISQPEPSHYVKTIRMEVSAMGFSDPSKVEQKDGLAGLAQA